MASAGFDFTDKTYSGEERLADLLALSRGTYTALQTLLRHVKSYNDLIEDDVEEHPAAAEYLHKSQWTLDRALGWLRALDQTVSCSPEAEKVDLRPLVEGVVQRCRRIVRGDLSVALSFDTEPSVVEVAVFQVQGVLLALLEDFTGRLSGPGVGACVRVEHVQMGQSDIALLKSRCSPGLYVALTISTNDVPFDVAEQTGFWEGLLHDWQRDADTDIGLLRAYGVFLGYGGEVLFGRQSDALSITVLLPVEAKRKDMQVEPNIEDEGLFGSETILLVDDEEMIWDVIIDMLQELGYSVVLAGNGLEAVEIYRENPGLIDLVMLDMVMPELDGHSAFFKLKEIDPDVRVLLSSGYVSEDDARDVLDAGAVGFLQKPYRMVDLARIMRSIFDGTV